MHILGNILQILDAQMPEPQLYGLFHVVSLVLCILIGILFYRLWPSANEQVIRRLLLVVSLVVILLEVYKQINFSFSYDGTAITFDYQWYAFPFQFCSTPMYVGLLAAIIPNQRIHNCLCTYLATYGLFAGIAVMVYPVSVFTETVGINIQTMVCHGAMVSIGMLLLLSGYVKTIWKAIPVFGVLVTSAALMNELAHLSGLLETETFNMFFISPYCSPELPVYSMVQGVVPFPLSLVLYILGFTVAASVPLLLAWGAFKVLTKPAEKVKL